MATDLLKYLASTPRTWKDWSYRLLLVVILVLGYLRLERIRQGQVVTQRKVDAVATVVATAVSGESEAPPERSGSAQFEP